MTLAAFVMQHQPNMFRIIFLLFLTTLTNIVLGQKYLTSVVRAKADSILKAYVGDSLFRYCSFDKQTRYYYRDIWGHSYFELFNTKKTKGKFAGVQMNWNLAIPYSKCPALDTIKGKTHITFDSLMQPIHEPPFNFIPDLYWRGDSCLFIQKREALAIARQQNLEKGIDSLNANLKYDEKTKVFTWEVSQTLKTQDEVGSWSKSEIVIIDPISGEVKKHNFIESFIDY